MCLEFNGKKTFGTSMGTRVAVAYAKMFVDRLEKTMLARPPPYSSHTNSLARYVNVSTDYQLAIIV